MKTLSPATMKFIQSKGIKKKVKRKLRLKDEIKAEMVHFPEISCLSHNFAETIVVNPRCILRNWRRFVFLKVKYKKTYLMFYTGITKREINAYLHSLFFGLCKVFFLTSFCNEYCKQLEPKFWKLKEVYRNNILIYNNLFQVLHIYLRLRYTKVSLDPYFA